jgi:putative transposase
MKFQASAHSFGVSALHIQLTPKKRRKVFMNKLLQEACKARFEEKAHQLHVSLEACDFGQDHCHLFITRFKNFSIPQLAQHFKGASSRQLREDFGDFLVHYKMGDSFWSDGYFYETCGNVSAEYRKYYVERMQKKHWVPN